MDPFSMVTRNDEHVFADDFCEEPYWWTAAPPDTQVEIDKFDQTISADVIVVGSGLTGVVAALHLARSGADVVVVDANGIGSGGTRRSGGFLSRVLRYSLDELTKLFGRAVAVAMYNELQESFLLVHDTVKREGIDCCINAHGRIVLANSPKHLRNLNAEFDILEREFGQKFSLLDQQAIKSEIGSDKYSGGLLFEDLGTIHPGLYHAGLVSCARSAGVRFLPFTAVTEVDAAGSVKVVKTERGPMSANHIVVTTNGYTTTDLSWFARRLIPFSGFMLATEEIDDALFDRVIPNRRCFIDSMTNADYIRPAGDTNRILFGGLTGAVRGSAMPKVHALRDRLVHVLPDLEGVKVSRVWTGRCAGTFDLQPHLGFHDGVHFAMGYNFAGIPMGTNFGIKIAKRILGAPDAHSAFDKEHFPSIPLYRGSGRLIVPIALSYYGIRDRIRSYL